MARFTGKVALVTGGTGGIGRATALAFAREGAKVVLSGRRPKDGLAAVEQISRAGGVARFLETDPTQPADVQRLVGETVATFGRLDVAFNNAGAEWPGVLTEVTDADARRVFELSVWSLLVSMRHEIAAMARTGGGAIVNMSNVGGHVALRGADVCIGTKYAVEGLTKVVALECARHRVRVNAVSPDVTTADVIDRLVGAARGTEPGVLPFPGRSAGAKQIADEVLFLTDPAMAHLSGVSLPVGSGRIAA
jgi:NAD(P)-dependent dehydrogenase (short-subunit alcohol dehydrogenase family)